MKRSELNMIMKDAIGFIDKMNFKLPLFAYLTPEQRKNPGEEYAEIKDNMLGWKHTKMIRKCINEKTTFIV